MPSFRKPFPNVLRERDRHGKTRWRFQKMVNGVRVRCYLPGPYGSQEFIRAYEEASNGARPAGQRAKAGTVAYMAQCYLESAAYRGLSYGSRYRMRGRIDWIIETIGSAKFAKVQPHHVAALMERKARGESQAEGPSKSTGGPAAANRVRKDLGQLYRFAARQLGYTGQNPAALADTHKTKKGGYRTWTDEEIETYRAAHPSGTKPRLALELLLGTGASRVDAIGMTRANIAGPRIRYRRAKTGQGVDLPILPELAAELAQLPLGQMPLIARDDGIAPYRNESFGNMLRKWIAKAGLEGLAAHGLRKAGARRLAEAGATEFEVMSFLGHGSAREASRYVAAANRASLADSGMAKLGAATRTTLADVSDLSDLSDSEKAMSESAVDSHFPGPKREQNCPNLSEG